MDEANLYWTVVAGIVSGIWLAVTFFRDRVSQSMQLSSMMISRILEYDKLIITNPDIQKYISQNVGRDDTYFRSDVILEDVLFYKTKTLIYLKLNLFDEILSASSKTKKWGFLKPAALIEISDWEEYIINELRHPLYRSILTHEIQIFGMSLRDFWIKNRTIIEAKSADPFIW